MTTVAQAGIPVAPLCRAISLSRSAFYRWIRPTCRTVTDRKPHWRALTEAERQQTLDVLNLPEFVDKAPAQVVHTLLDQGKYLCSERTMYRIMDDHDQVRERRSLARQPVYAKPELVATRPNQVWSWDITRLKTFVKAQYLYLYLILDLFSRFAVGWMLAHHENARLAKRLIAESAFREGIQPKELILHSDRGAPMTARTTHRLLEKLDITPSFNRPRVSNDNPYSESAFKTLKYSPACPDRFVGLTDSRSWAQTLFRYYNYDHKHSGLAYLTPYHVHYGQSQQVVGQRNQTLAAAFALHPERFPNGPPTAHLPPTEVWINKPPKTAPNAH